MVISFGGYVSVPVVTAAAILHVPSITHEQTLTLSLATKINAFFSKKIALSFEETNSKNILPADKVIITGNPIRTEIFNKTSKKFSFLDNKIKTFPLIYVTGGSQGSDFINQLIVKILPQLNNFTIIHQTGQINLNKVKNLTDKLKLTNYFPVDYVNSEDIGWVLNHANLVIGRSGANNCLDLHVLNKKSILIPLPFAQQNEQLLNAQWLLKNHPHQVIICPQSTATPQTLLIAITKLNLRPSESKIVTQPKIDPLFKLIHEMV